MIFKISIKKHNMFANKKRAVMKIFILPERIFPGVIPTF